MFFRFVDRCKGNRLIERGGKQACCSPTLLFIYLIGIYAIAQEFPYLPLYRVRGNCDYYDDVTPEQALLRLEGVRLLAVHGHRCGVKTGLLRLCYAAREKDAQVALFGHTHRGFCTQTDGLWLLNPGACGGRAPSYGVAELENGAVKCCVKELYLEE